MRKVFKEELELQMDLAKKADQLRDIEADALSAAGDDRLLDEPSGIDFKPSQVPGEAFVAAAKHNDQVGKTALKVFKDKALMFPSPMRQFLWEDFIYTYRNAGQHVKKTKVSPGWVPVLHFLNFSPRHMHWYSSNKLSANSVSLQAS